MKMQKPFLLFIFLLPTIFSSAQRTENKYVPFENLRGFSGSVTFDVGFNGFATVLKGNKGVLVLKKYEATDEELKVLLAAGYDLRGFPQSGHTPEKYAFVVRGQAKVGMLSFYGSTQHKAIGLDKLQLSESMGDFTTPDFEESMKEAARKWQKESKKSHWEETGTFTDIEVSELYISEFEETIRKILGKAAEITRLENAEDAANEAQKYLMHGHLDRAISLLEKAYKLDPANKTMIRVSREYARKVKEKEEKDLQNIIIEAEINQRLRQQQQAVSEAKEIQTLRSWQSGSPANFSPQNQARLNELTKRETERNLAKLNDIFEAGRERIRERSRQRMAQIEEQYRRSIAELNEKYAREKRETIAATEREKEIIRKKNILSEKKRLAKYGYREGESQEEMKANVRKMAAEIPPGDFTNGLAPLKYFKYGYINKNGDIVVPFKYDRANEFHEGLASVSYEDIYLGDMYEERKVKAGYINSSGKEIIPLRYHYASDFKSGLALVTYNDKSGIINRSGSEIVPIEYDFLDPAGDGLVRAQKNNMFGYLEGHTGRAVIPLKYTSILFFRDGLAAAKLNGKWGFLDQKGKVVIPFRYEKVENGGFNLGSATVVEAGTKIKINRFGSRVDFQSLLYDESEGMIPVKFDDKYGFVNNNHEMLVRPEYHEYKKFRGGIAMVRKEALWGGIDKNGNTVIPFRYKNVGYGFSDGFLNVLNEKDMWGYIDKNGKEIIPFKFESASTFHTELHIAEAKKDGKYGIIDNKGKTRIPFKYDKLSISEAAHLNLIRVEKNGKIGYLNAKGKQVVPIIYDEVPSSFYKSAIAKVVKDGKQGLIDASGTEIVPVKYDFIAQFKEDVAFAKLNGKYGFIDSSGNTIIPFKYDTAFDFIKGFTEVRLNNETFILNKKGEHQEGKAFIQVSDFYEGTAIAMQHGKYGYIDENQKFITPCKYESVRFIQDGMGMVWGYQGGDDVKFGFVDHTGKEVIPMKYKKFVSYDDRFGNYKYFANGIVEAEFNGKHGFINKSGAEVIPVIYPQMGKFSEGLVRVLNDHNNEIPKEQQNKWAYFDADGKKKIDFRFSQARDFSDGYAYVQTGKESGFIDHSGELVIRLSGKYKQVGDFIGGIAVASNEEGLGFINKQGKEVLPFEYSSYNMGNGYISLKKGDKYGVVDVNGKIVIPFVYNILFFELGGFMSNEKTTDFVVSREAEKWALIRLSDGKQITSHRFDFISSFYDNALTTFRIDNKWGVLNRDGAEIIPAEYEKIVYYPDLNCMAVCRNEKWGMLNQHGDLVVPIRYESIYISERGNNVRIIAVNTDGTEVSYGTDDFELIRQ